MIKSKNKSSIKNRRQKKSIFLLVVFYFMLTIFLGGFVYILFFSTSLQISSIEIIGSKNIEKQLILDKVSAELSGEYLGYIKKNNLLLVKNRKIEKEILAQFKDLRNVEISRKFPNSLNVKVVERISELILCGNDSCFIIDENGQAYNRVDFSNRGNRGELLVVTDESKREIKEGEIILNQDYIKYAQGIEKNIFEILNLEVENNFRTPSLISKDMRIRVKEGWGIFFSQNISLEKETEMLKLALEKKIEPKQRLNLEYIDLRIDNKIYYKFKDGTPEELLRQAELEKNNTDLGITTPIMEKDKKSNKK